MSMDWNFQQSKKINSPQNGCNSFLSRAQQDFVNINNIILKYKQKAKKLEEQVFWKMGKFRRISLFNLKTTYTAMVTKIV
jgi:hypothetical protein